MGIAINQQDAVVTQIVGQLRAKDEQGNVRTLNIGDIIHQGEQLIFASDDKFVIEYADGTRMSEVNMQSQAQTTPASTQMPDLPADATDAEIAALQAQILAGQDPTADLPETAAGAGGGGTEGGFDYTSVGRDGAETLASAGWDTTGFTTTTLTAQQEPLLTDILPEAPFLANANLTFSDAALPLGSTPDAQQVTQDGTLAFSATSGVLNISIDGVAIVTDGIFNGPVTISTSYGVLTISGVDLANGILSFSFTQTAAVDHSQGDIFNQLFSLLLTDNLGVTTSSTLTISVGDDAPSGQNDSNSLSEDTSLAVIGNLLANDTQGADTAQVTAAGAGSATNISVGQASQINGSFGVLTLNSDGSYSYQLNTGLQAVQALAQGQTLNEVFSYVLQDADGDISVQTLTITITGSNDAPVITTEQGQDLGTVIEAGNFDDGSFNPGVPSVSGNLSASDVDNGAVLTWSGNADSPFGSFSIDAATGAWTYVLDNSAADSLQEGEVRIETFLVTVTDEFGATATQEVTITIVGSNDAPILSAETSGSVTEDQNVSAGMLVDSGALSFTDVDLGDDHQMSSSYNGDISWSGGSLTQDQINALLAGFSVDSNSWDYSIANSLVQFLSVGETITLSFTVTVTDEFGASDSQVVTLTIHGTNDAPVITTEQGQALGTVIEAGNFDDGSFNPGVPSVSGNLSASDVDNGAVLTWSGNADSPFGSFSIDAATGAWTYVLDNSAADSLQEGEVRIETFLVTVTDEFGATATQEVTITIVGSNDAPILSAETSGSVTEDQNVSAGMLVDSGALSFTDVDLGDDHQMSSSYNGDINWSGGSLTQDQINALLAGFSVDSNSWDYSIANSLVQFLSIGETITLSFTVTVTDEFGASDSQVVTLTIHGTNDGPVINPPAEGDADGTVIEAGNFDNGNVDPGSPEISGTLTATDADHDAVLTWSGNAEGEFGDFVIDPETGTWTYTIDNSAADSLQEGETRTETFLVTVTDQNGATSTQEVTITIVGSNDAPILTLDDSGSVIEDVDVVAGMLSDSGALSFTDVDVGDSHEISTSYNGDISWSGGALTLAEINALVAGFSADSDSWDFNIANSLVQFLAVGETITLSFTVTVTDEFGASDSQQVNITITGTNDAPVLTVDTSGSVTEDVNVLAGMLSDSGTLSFSDVDVNDSHSVSSLYNNDISWSGGALTQDQINALVAGFSADSDSWDYSIANSLVQFLAVGETITLSFNVSVDDGHGGIDTETVTITINGTNDAPVLTVDTSGSVTEDVNVLAGMLSDSGALSFSDVDVNDSHSVSSLYNNDISWSGGALTQDQINALVAGFSADSDSWDYSIANSLVQFLAVGETITLSFNVSVDDGHGGIDTETVTITINGTNDAPVLTVDTSGSVTEDVNVLAGMLSDSGTLSFSDVDVNDSHSVSSLYNNDISWSGGALTQDQINALVAGFSADSDSWDYSIANSLVQFLGVGETITLSFNVSVDDGHGGIDTETVTITINGTNDAPVLTVDTSGSVTEDVNVLAGMLSDSGTLSFSDVDVNDSHSVSSLYNGDISWSGGALTQDQINALVAGFSADSDSWDYSIANSLVQFLAVGETITLSFNISVDDGHGGIDTDTVTITINGTNDAPVLTVDTSGSVTEDVNVLAGMLSDSGTLSFTDVDVNDSHSVSSLYNGDISWSGGALTQDQINALVAGFSADSDSWDYSIANSLVQFLAVGETITLSFNVSVDDGHGGIDTDTVTITINGTNDAPVLTVDTSGSVTEDVDVLAGMLSDSGALSFTDVDVNDSHSVSSLYNGDISWSGGALTQDQINALVAGFSADSDSWDYSIANSLVQFLAVGETITLSFNVSVDDGHGGIDTDTVTITINGTNDAPVLTVDTSGSVTEDVNVLAGMLSDSGALSFSDVDVNDSHSVSSLYNGDISWSGGALTQDQINALVAGFSADSDSWDYSIVNSLVQFLAVGETITLSFNVSVDDGHGGIDTETVTITINGTNDAPVLTVDTSGSVTEDVNVLAGMLSDSGALSFSDVDVNDSHSVSSLYNNDISWSGGALTQDQINALVAGFSADSDSWDYSIANSLVQFLAVGETITLSFNVSVDDGHGGIDTETVTITINGTNDAPVLTVDTSGSVTEDVNVLAGMLSDSGTLSFSDVDVNDSHSVSSLYNNDISWSGGALTQDQINALVAGFSADSDSWDYSIANSLVQFLGVGETITLSFNVSVDDGHGGIDTETVTITINGTNDAPVLTVDTSGSVTEDVNVLAGMLSDSGTLSFSDVDVNDSHSVSSLYNGDISWSGGALTQDQINALVAGFSADSDSWDYSIANSLVQFLAVGETITLSFNVSVDDGHGGIDTETVTITINGTNDAPVLTVDTSGSVTEDVNVLAGMLSDSGTLSFSDVDVNDSHSVSSLYNGDISWSGGALTQDQINALVAGFNLVNGGWTYSIDNDLIQFLAEGETITLSFDVTVDDGNGGTDTKTVSITINGTNDAVEGEFAKEIWVPASMAELLNPYDDGYPLHIAVPTDTDVNDTISITNISMAFVDQNVVADIGTLWYVDDDTNLLTQFDFDNPVSLSAAELGTLVYMPGDNGDLDSQLDISLTFTVNSGAEQVQGDFVIHTVPQNSLGDNSVLIGDGSSPLTSGNDQDAYLTVSSGFAEVLNTDPSLGTLDLFTDFQKSPFDIPIPAGEIGGVTGQEREDEVSVRLTINGITFIVIAAANGVTDWTFDVDSGLMKASVAYDSILMESDLSTTLAQYLAANPVSAGDIWTITYLDNDGGSYQARFVQATFTHELLPDTAITVTGTDNVDNLIFGTTEGDILTGANLNDEIVGREGNDIIKGLAGDDELLGGSGNDTIEGGTGADYLIGGLGSDSLDAGIDTDRDILVWDTGSADGSTDDVYHFDPDHDALDLSDILLDEENGSLEDYLSFSFGGGDTTITIDSNGAAPGGDTVTIVLHGTDLSAIYGSANETDIIQGMLGDNALLVTQPPAPPILPEANHVVLQDEHSIP
ncbi:retention module-containing protein [Shewanella cyperi]|uniref:Retention module-containing protein n=1 Tax=Shewanella cyperi TaxID=2814292 RepID=A0A974XM40_9GAMM|nr:retention module-containing protein [Shewanella cyperi]QSX29768.1 retention module-containing protein [Shewanella cyperi]